jgi:hypothetical protein
MLNSILTRDDILASQDLTFEIVDVPEWGGQVRVKALTATERDAFEASMVVGTGKVQKVDMHNVRAKLCAYTICDMDGARLFSESDVALLGQKSAAALDRVYGVASRLSKITKEDVDEIVGNSESAH